MKEAGTLILACGIAGQTLFGGRVLVQWIASERARRCVVPRVYWYLGLLGACLVLVYAVGVHNPVYVLSVAPGAFIAMRNLRISRAAARRKLIPWAIALAAVLCWTTISKPHLGPPVWAGIGFLGSILWAGRQLVQWWKSERLGASTLPVSFWVLSLGGGVLLSAYAIALADWIMLAGYGTGCIPYVRNLLLLRRQARTVSPA